MQVPIFPEIRHSVDSKVFLKLKALDNFNGVFEKCFCLMNMIVHNCSAKTVCHPTLSGYE